MTSVFQILHRHIWVFPLALSILFFPINGVHTSPDASWYLSNALNLYKGHGYVDADLSPILNRGPVFPSLIAFSFLIFGVSVSSALWVVRFFYVLNVLLIYLIGCKFYDKWTGLTASLFVLTSYVIAQYSSLIILDIVMPFFVLLFIFILKIAYQKENYLCFGLSGLTLGVAYLTKESAILFIPLPLLLCLVSWKFRTPKILIGLLVFITAFGISVSPWLYHVYNTSYDLTLLLGAGGQGVAGFLSGNTVDNSNNILVGSIKYIKYLLNYYHSYFSETIVISTIILFAWIFFIAKSVCHKKTSDLLIAISLLLFLPLCIYFGAREMRKGQNILIYFLSYLVLSHFIISSAEFLSKQAYLKVFKDPKKSNYHMIIIAATLILALIGIQIFGDPKMFKVIKGKTNKGFTYYLNNRFKVTGWHNEKVQRAAEYITSHIDINDNLVCDWYYLRSLYFYTDGKYRILRMPYRISRKRNINLLESNTFADTICEPIFLLPNKNQTNLRNYLRAFCKNDLLSILANNNIKYVITTPERDFLSIYFKDNQMFEKIWDLDQIKIYKVKDIKSLKEFQVRIGSRLTEFLNKLRKASPKKYRHLHDDYLVRSLNLSPKEITKILNGDFPAFDTN